MVKDSISISEHGLHRSSHSKFSAFRAYHWGSLLMPPCSFQTRFSVFKQHTHTHTHIHTHSFPGSSSGKESACNVGDPSSIPGLGRTPGEGAGYPLQYSWVSPVAQMVKNSPLMQETWVWSQGWEDPLEKGMATHSIILAWRIPMDRGAWRVTVHGSKRIRHDWTTKHSTAHTHKHRAAPTWASPICFPCPQLLTACPEAVPSHQYTRVPSLCSMASVSCMLYHEHFMVHLPSKDHWQLTDIKRFCTIICYHLPSTHRSMNVGVLIIHSYFFPFIFISWRVITLQYCSGFYHVLTWISHGFTCIPHPEPPSSLPLHLIPLGLPSATAPSTCLMHPTWAGDLFHPWW